MELSVKDFDDLGFSKGWTGAWGRLRWQDTMLNVEISAADHEIELI